MNAAIQKTLDDYADSIRRDLHQWLNAWVVHLFGKDLTAADYLKVFRDHQISTVIQPDDDFRGETNWILVNGQRVARHHRRFEGGQIVVEADYPK